MEEKREMEGVSAGSQIMQHALSAFSPKVRNKAGKTCLCRWWTGRESGLNLPLAKCQRAKRIAKVWFFLYQAKTKEMRLFCGYLFLCTFISLRVTEPTRQPQVNPINNLEVLLLPRGGNDFRVNRAQQAGGCKLCFQANYRLHFDGDAKSFKMRYIS